MPQQNRIVMGYIYAATAAVLWSFIAPLSKNCLSAGVAPLETAFWRAFLGGVCFAVQAALNKGLLIPWRHALIFLLFGVLGIGVLFGALQVSIQLSGAAMAMILLYTAPIWVAIVARVMFMEGISRQKLLAIGIALAGVALVCASGGSLPAEYSMLGIACGLLSGLAYASHFPFYTWWCRHYSTGTIYAYMLLGGAAAILPFTGILSAGGAVRAHSPEAWLNLLALGVVTNYIAYLALAASLRRVSQVQSAVVGNLEPILAALWVWLFFAENFTPSGWFGCALVIGAVFIMTMEKPKHNKNAPISES